jgi:hypothetical protein
MGRRLAPLLLAAAATAAAACGGAATHTISTTTLTAPRLAVQQRPSSPASDQLRELIVELRTTTAAPNAGAVAQALSSAFPGTQVTALDIDDADTATCSKGAGAPLRAFIRDRLPRTEVGAAGLLDQVVALIDQRCPLTPPEYLELQSVALVELARNGMRSATTAALSEEDLNTQACEVLRTARAIDRHIVDGLGLVAARNRLAAGGALDVAVKAVVQACPIFIADLRGVVDELRRA